MPKRGRSLPSSSSSGSDASSDAAPARGGRVQRRRGHAPARKARGAGARAGRARSRKAGKAAAKLDDLTARFLAWRGVRGAGAVVTPVQAALSVAGSLLLYDRAGTLLIPSSARTALDRTRAAELLSGLSRPTVEKILGRFGDTGVVSGELERARGPKPHNLAQLVALGPEIKEKILELYAPDIVTGETPAPWVTRMLIRTMIFDMTGLVVGWRRLTTLFSLIGLEYGRLNKPRTVFKPKLIMLRRVFLMKLGRYIQLNYTLHFTDESYANQRLHHATGFFDKDDPRPSAWWVLKPGSGLGQRICYKQVFSPNGFLGGLDEDRVPMGDIVSETPHGEMMFEAGNSKDADYHKGNFDGSVIIRHTKLRYLPYLRKHMPEIFEGERGELDKKVVYFVDNAKYNCNSTPVEEEDDSYFNPLSTSLSKPVLFRLLRAVGCDELEVEFGWTDKDGDEFVTIIVGTSEDSAVKKGGKFVPNLPAIRIAAFTWLGVNNPRVLLNDLERLIESECNGNVLVVFLAPYFPEVSAIEMAWVPPKLMSRLRFTASRKIAELEEHITLGLYTDELCQPGNAAARGGHFVAGADGKCPEAKALFDHCFFSAKGGAQMALDADEVLAGCTLNNLVVPAPYEAMVEAQGRAYTHFLVGCKVAEDEGVDLNELLEDDASDSDEED
jgi:hypothetical protein